jgi:CRP-like cAMP-binding protein
MQTLEVSAPTWQAILAKSQPLRCGAGSLIFSQNEPATGMYLVCSGDVWLSLPTHRFTLFGRHVRQGSLIGLSAAMTGTAYSLSAEAMSEVQLGFVPAEMLSELMADAGVAFELVRLLSIEVKTLDEKLKLAPIEIAARKRLGHDL